MKIRLKSMLWLMLLALVLVLGACGKDNREQMSDSLKKAYGDKQAAGTFELKIKELALNDSNTSSSSMIASQVENIKVAGNYIKNNKASEVNLKLQGLGTEIPFTLVGNAKNTYISTDFVEPVAKLVTSFGSEVPISEAQLAKIKGKYLSLRELTDYSDPEVKTQVDRKTAGDFASDYQKALRKYVNNLDKKSFKKDGDVITHTFGKKELQKMTELMKKTADSKKEYASYQKLLAKNDLKATMDKFKSVTVKVAVNEKTDKTVMTYRFVPKADNYGYKTIAIQLTVTPQKYSKAPVMPNKADVLTSKEFEQIMEEAETKAPSAAGSTAPSAANTTISDAQFEQVIKQVKQIKASGQTIDQARKDQLLKTYKSYLTDKQYQELERVLAE